MNLHTNSNKIEQFLQENLKIWDDTILPYLPKQLDKLAEQSGMLQRKRAFVLQSIC